MMCKPTFALRKVVVCITLLALLLSACQLDEQLSPTQDAHPIEMPAVHPTNDETQAVAPESRMDSTKTVGSTFAETLTPVISPTITPNTTPKPRAIKILKSELLNSFVSEVHLPENVVWTDDSDEADFYFAVVNQRNLNTAFDRTEWTYVLVAPFFTIPDEIELSDLRQLMRGSQTVAEKLGVHRILLAESDFQPVMELLNITNPSNAVVKKVANGGIKANPWGEDWAIIPFEQLSPEWKVIAIDGVSPLDHNFEPYAYALNLNVGLMSALESGDTVENDYYSKILPLPNRDLSQLTSLIMTGVTAMARDTAYVMETEGTLFPGTEIRDIMRNADLTHISNEVSFFEDCPLPDPDYEGFIFCSNPEYIKLLDDLGADIIELTGNHNNDVFALYKVDSVPFTLDLYEQYGMRWYAGGVNVEDAKAPLLIEHNGNKLAFIGCNSYGPDMAWATEERSGAAPCEDFGWLKAEVSRLREEGYLPIVTFQFQEDYLREATSLQLRDFREVATAAPVIINGSQSHVAKAMEFYKDSFIDYGLGNLFFDQPDFYITYDSFIQEHYFYQGRYISTRLHTITIEETGKPRPMTEEERSEFLTVIFTVSEPLRSEQ